MSLFHYLLAIQPLIVGRTPTILIRKTIKTERSCQEGNAPSKDLLGHRSMLIFWCSVKPQSNLGLCGMYIDSNFPFVKNIYAKFVMRRVERENSLSSHDKETSQKLFEISVDP